MDVFSVLLFRSKPNTVTIHSTTFGGRAVDRKKAIRVYDHTERTGLGCFCRLPWNGGSRPPWRENSNSLLRGFLISRRASKKASVDIAMLDSYHTEHEGKRGRC